MDIPDTITITATPPGLQGQGILDPGVEATPTDTYVAPDARRPSGLVVEVEGTRYKVPRSCYTDKKG